MGIKVAAVWFILFGLSQFISIGALAGPVLGILAIIAGILILLGR